MRKRKRSALVSLLIVWGIALSVQMAHADGLEFNGNISVSETYDDNINLQAVNKKEDFITAVTPSFSVSRETRKTTLGSVYSPEMRFYAANSNENELNHNAQINYNARLKKRTTLNARDNLTFTRAQDISGRLIGSRSYSSDQTNNTLNITLSHQASTDRRVQLGFSQRLVDYEKNTLEDSQILGSSLGIFQKITDRDTLTLQYFYQKFLYDRAPDSLAHSISIGQTHEFSRNLSLGVTGGVDRVEEDAGDDLSWRAGLNFIKSFKKASIAFAYDRRVSSGEGAGGTSVNQIFSLVGNKHLTRHLQGNVSWFFATQKSIFGGAVENEDAGMTLGVGYDFTKRLNGNAGISYVHQNAKGGIGEDTQTFRGSIGTTYRLRQKLRTFFSYRYYQENFSILGRDDIQSNLATAGIYFEWF